MSENTTNLNEEKIEETNEEINKQNVGKNENIPPFNAQTNGTDPSFMVDGKKRIYNYKGEIIKKPFYSIQYAFLTLLLSPLVPFFLYKKYSYGFVAYIIYFPLFFMGIFVSFNNIINVIFTFLIMGFVYPKLLPINKVKESVFIGVLGAIIAYSILALSSVIILNEFSDTLPPSVIVRLLYARAFLTIFGI